MASETIMLVIVAAVAIAGIAGMVFATNYQTSSEQNSAGAATLWCHTECFAYNAQHQCTAYITVCDKKASLGLRIWF